MAKDDNALIFRIGVDPTSLYEDLSNATSGLKERIEQINTRLKSNKIRLETQIETAQLDKDWKKANDLIAQKREHELAANKAILNAYMQAFNAMTAEEKKNFEALEPLLKNITTYTKRVEKAQKAVDSWNKSQSFAGAIGVMKDSVIDALQAINPAAATMLRGLDDTFSKATKRIDTIRGKLTSPKGIATVSGAALFGIGYGINSFFDNMEKKAVTTATNIENLQRKASSLGLSFKDFSSINTLGKLAGVDIDPAIDRIGQLNKAISTAGESGNKTTRILDKWGITLRNQDGTYKSFTEQLQILAAGYQEAVANGNSYAYSVEVLGSGLADVLPLLKDYAKYQAEANEITKTGYANQEAIAKLLDAKRRYDVQDAQNNIGGYLGVEGATAYYEEMYKVAQSWAAFNKENKELMQNLSKFAIMWEHTFAGIGQQAKKIAAELLSTKNLRLATATAGGAAIGGAAGAFFGGFGAVPGALIGGGIGLAAELIAEQTNASQEAEEAANSATDAQEEQKKATEATTAALKEQAEQAEKIEKLNSDISEKIYKLTHSDRENELHSLENERAKYLDDGADSDKVNEFYSLQRAKIEQKYQEQAEKAREQAEAKAKAEQEKALKEQEDMLKKQQEEQKKLAEEAKKQAEERANAEKAISDVFKSEHQKRLAQIEDQRQAWLKAGADEVAATRATEEEKRKARESEAQRYLRDNADLIKRASKLEAAGLSTDDIMQNLQQYQLQKTYKDLGLNASQINVGAKYMGLLDNMRDISQSIATAPVVNRLITNNNSASNNANITINIDRPYVRNSSDMSDLAEEVAGKLKEAISFGGLVNGY